MYYQLIYASTASPDLTEADVMAIMRKAQQNNKRRGITGLTLYKNGNFMQIIEGEREVVESLYQTISRDPRHMNVMAIMTRSVPEREFGEWTMGIHDLNNFDLRTLEAYNPVFEYPLNSQTFVDDASHALAFIRAFKNHG